MDDVADIVVVSSDDAFLEALKQRLESLGLRARMFDEHASALDSLATQAPMLLILEWHHDMATVDFLIHISEQLCWGDMDVFFVSPRPLDESEHFQMQSLGVHSCFVKGALVQETPNLEFTEAVLRALETA